MFLKISQNWQENTCARVCQSLLQLLNKRLRHRCFPVSFVKFLRKPFLKSSSGRLLLTLNDFSFSLLYLQLRCTWVTILHWNRCSSCFSCNKELHNISTNSSWDIKKSYQERSKKRSNDIRTYNICMFRASWNSMGIWNICSW